MADPAHGVDAVVVARRDTPPTEASIRVIDVAVHYFDLATRRFSCGAASVRPQWTLHLDLVTCTRCRELLATAGMRDASRDFR